MFKVYITSIIPEIGVNLLKRRGYDVEVNDSQEDLTKDRLKQIFSKSDAILTLMTDKIDKELINSASKQLKIIANFAVGYDNIDIAAASKKGIIVTNTPGVASESVAEHTLMMILACAKKLIVVDKYVREGKYKRWDPMAFLSSQIWGETIGIIGLGRIGMFLGQMVYHGLRMNILYNDISRSEDFELLCEAKFVIIQTLLETCDVVTIHVPLTEKTYHLIGENELKRMKNSAILINTSRGPVVDEAALIWALKEGQIAAAGLDVFEFEPRICEELRVMENVVLTPHIASATIETREMMAKVAAENIIAVLEGKQSATVVNPKN